MNLLPFPLKWLKAMWTTTKASVKLLITDTVVGQRAN